MINQNLIDMKKFFVTLMMLLCAAFSFAVQAQINPQQAIPADEQIRKGVLPNGLTYYVRHNEKPKGMANFYIVHDVGAVQEGDNQQGLAHFLEHMAFNGTKNYPDKTMIEYLEKIGVQCPNCGKDIVIRKTKKGRKYYGCVDNPNCEYMSWKKPTLTESKK